MENKSAPIYVISVVSKMLNIHPQTLRLYEKRGFIKPMRTPGNTRLYSSTDVEKIEELLKLTQDIGVNLPGAEIILAMKNRIQNLQETLNGIIDILQQKIEKGIYLPETKELVTSLLKYLEKAKHQSSNLP